MILRDLIANAYGGNVNKYIGMGGLKWREEEGGYEGEWCVPDPTQASARTTSVGVGGGDDGGM